MNGDKPNCLSPDNKSKSKTFEYEKNLLLEEQDLHTAKSPK